MEIKTKFSSRVGLLGNPSDLYYGHVISKTVDKFNVEAILKEANQNCFEINGNEDDGLDSLIGSSMEFLKKNGYKLGCFNFSIKSNIPKQAGLGGSAAIIISFLDSINKMFNLKMNKRLIAHYATKIEHEEIGITAGPQDRFVITFGGAKYMDFSSKDFNSYVIEDIDISDFPFYIGVRSKNISSGDVHKFPFDTYPSNGTLQKIVTQISQCAILGKQAIIDNDIKSLGALMNKNQNLTQRYGEFGNPNERVKLQRSIDQEILTFCNNNGVIGAKLGGSSGSIIILSEEKPQFLYDFKLSENIRSELKKFDSNPDSRQVSEIVKL